MGYTSNFASSLHLSEIAPAKADADSQIDTSSAWIPDAGEKYKKDSRLRRQWSGALIAGAIAVTFGLFETTATKYGLSHCIEPVRDLAASGKHVPFGYISQAVANQLRLRGRKVPGAIGVLAVGAALTAVVDASGETLQAAALPSEHHNPVDWIENFGKQGNGQDLVNAEAGVALHVAVNPEPIIERWQAARARNLDEELAAMTARSEDTDVMIV